MAISYDEDTGMFTKQHPYFFGLLHSDEMLYEKDLSINTINDMKEQSHKTTFTDDDIDTMYKFACLEFKFNHDKNMFKSIPIKEIFLMSDDKLILNKIAPMAYDYTNKIVSGQKQVIERFTTPDINCLDNDNIETQFAYIWMIIIFIIFLIFLIMCL